MAQIDCQGRPEHLSGTAVYVEVIERGATHSLISDRAAVTIASWWQSPGRDGAPFAELASTGRCDYYALIRVIGAAREEATEDVDRAALNALRNWATDRHNRTVTA